MSDAHVRLIRISSLLALFCLGLYLPGILSMPVTDRDEARFAQASKQMVETGDFVNINLQDEPRHKKPIGIYWLQAAAVEIVGLDHRSEIWVYRLPSLAAAMILVIATAALGNLLFGETAAILGGLLMATSLVLFGEAMLAKTDAALAASVAVAQLCLARIYVPRQPVAFGTAMLFWFAIGCSILLKGPVGPAVVALTAITLSIIERDVSWLRQTRPLAGIALCLAVTLPWFAAIGFETHGAFFSAAVGGDLAPKLRSGGDLYHGAPPGYHTLLLFLVFWPASLFLVPAAIEAWRGRRARDVAFLIAWFLPSLVMFEIVPNKLPHYTLPILPALALLCARAIVGGGPVLQSWPARVSYGIASLAGVALAAVAIGAPIYFGGGYRPESELPAGLAAVAAVAPAVLAWRARYLQAAMTAVLLAGLSVATLLALVGPSLDKLFLTPRMAAIEEAIDPARARPIVVAGYSEASVPFLMGTGVKLADTGEQAAERILNDASTLAFVELRQQPQFLQRLEAQQVAVEPVGTVEGLNYSAGRKVLITLFTRR